VLEIEIELLDSGLLRTRATVRNDASNSVRIDAFELRLPVPAVANEILDFAGRWAKERFPQRHTFDVGQWVRESRGGRPGLDAPFLLAAGPTGFGFREGSVWAVHLAWSGNQVYSAERTYTGVSTLGAGEILLPDEVVIGEGESYTTPWLYGAHGEGLDAVAARFHVFLRSRVEHPSLPRPVGLNTWEAVYFDHDIDHLLHLADRAAELGVERFVLDDGWFLGRRDDTSALGDWFVDPGVWPNGLGPLVDRVKHLGMQFGLWFEPEMVSPNSNVAVTHPEWLFDAGHGPGIASRHQFVLDLGHADAFKYIRDRISSLIDEYGVDYIKWDHNRPLTDAGHQPTGVAGVRAQTLATYRMMEELKGRHPRLEIESCASGGGRIDLGMLQYTDRVWTSDCNDPHERLEIQRYTGLIVPPEMQGTHIGPERAHTTGRTNILAYRAEKALWGHMGIEVDLSVLPSEEFAAIGEWLQIHRKFRHLLHTGAVVHADLVDPSYRLEGVVDHDGAEGLFAFSCVAWSPNARPGRIPFPALKDDRSYRVSIVRTTARDEDKGVMAPPWMREPIVLPGAVLGTVGLEMPIMVPDRSVILRLAATNQE
jgi:alpha-galactosidase